MVYRIITNGTELPRIYVPPSIKIYNRELPATNTHTTGLKWKRKSIIVNRLNGTVYVLVN